MVRSMYELRTVVFPENYSCVVFLDLSMSRRTVCFARILGIFSF